ncbi:MAG: NAD+ synthase, partial [SAR324 cluster bacterium]|nr:NAD+ synthase [SAR324 cluster bacterium]
MNLKIAIAQIPSTPGRIRENTELIISKIRIAKSKKASLVVFPELSIPGYLLMDLCFNQSFLDEQRSAIERIALETNGIGVILGYVRESSNQRPGGRRSLYNSAAFINNGKFEGFQDKILLPDYDIFDEHRYFLSGEEPRIFSLNGKKIGIAICEDLWQKGYKQNPLADLKALGAELLVNISASPFEIGKFEERYRVVSDAVSSYGLPLVYTNLIGSFDGFDGEVVFDG